MIRLNVKEYCNNCPEFEAQTNKVYYTYKVEPEIHTTVTCKNMEKCERIKERLACDNHPLSAKWEKENYDKVLVRFPKRTKEKITATGAKSVNGFIVEAVQEKLNK